ncbi:hypothetical protein N7466_006658 [Penicillium verhagenii]|uniref:uncharacterized protein n=1 Tax=Penicillium verhagenii TaxID=1562060 RepID=UPI002545AFF1|nr:uncharacterized protein N7466_006658 [Penicillium verhagenii]KAJ5931165.1 hypothetical protein N7466_006658 [Penicillium verhagenii]
MVVSKEDYDDIQGDIWPGLSKQYEEFYFFTIEDAELFRPVLQKLADEVITSATHAMAARYEIQMVKNAEAGKKAQEQPKKNTNTRGSGGGGLFGLVNDAFDTAGSVAKGGIDLAGNVANAAVDITIGVARFPFDVIASLVPKDPKDIPRCKGDKTKLWNPTEDFNDDIYFKGMEQDLIGEGRDQAKHWEKEFLKTASAPSKTDGMVIVCGTKEEVQEKLADLKHNYLGENQGCRYVTSWKGQERPDKLRGHEHFGYLDGISQPLLAGFDDDLLKAEGARKYATRPGIIIFGHDGEGDNEPGMQHPTWAKNGSYQVVRKLKQLVPEWNTYVEEEGAKHGFTPGQFGARLMGRWKSGAPVELHPWEDHPEHARFNDFDYDPKSGANCPFGSHMRKTKPRADVKNKDKFDIMRRGLPYGPEHDPATEPTTTQDRGLVFVCYQTTLQNGFSFLKNKWCNADNFPTKKEKYIGGLLPGQDAVIGQSLPSTKQADDAVLTLTITDKQGEHKTLQFPSFVEAQGGDYFFTPSLTLLRTISGAAPN